MRIHRPLTFALLAAACLPAAEDGANPASPRGGDAGGDATAAPEPQRVPMPTVRWSCERDGDHLLVHCDVEFDGEATPRYVHFDDLVLGPASAERSSLDRPQFASRLGPRREWRSVTPEVPLRMTGRFPYPEGEHEAVPVRCRIHLLTDRDNGTRLLDGRVQLPSATVELR